MSTQNLAELLNRLGYLRQGHLVAVKRDDLVGQDIVETISKANRLLARDGKSLTKKDLMTIKAEDILASRVFKENIPDCVIA